MVNSYRAQEEAPSVRTGRLHTNHSTFNRIKSINLFKKSASTPSCNTFILVSILPEFFRYHTIIERVPQYHFSIFIVLLLFIYKYCTILYPYFCIYSHFCSHFSKKHRHISNKVLLYIHHKWNGFHIEIKPQAQTCGKKMPAMERVP